MCTEEHIRESTYWTTIERTSARCSSVHLLHYTCTLVCHYVSVWDVRLLCFCLLLLSSLPFCIYLSTHTHKTDFFSNGLFSTTHCVHTLSYCCPEERKIPLCALTHPHTPLSPFPFTLRMQNLTVSVSFFPFTFWKSSRNSPTLHSKQTNPLHEYVSEVFLAQEWT